MPKLRVHVAMDGSLYREHVLRVAQGKSAEPEEGEEAAQEEYEADIAQNWIPVLIFLPLRLGLDDRINPQYAPALKALLETAMRWHHRRQADRRIILLGSPARTACSIWTRIRSSPHCDRVATKRGRRAPM